MPGAAGLIGMRTGARSAPDGYTVIAPNDSVLTMLPNIKADAGYDPFTDFIPVTQLVGIPLGLIANPSFAGQGRRRSHPMAKEKARRITYASGGPGSPQHVGMELFMRAAGITMTHVPYRGVTPAVQDVVGGQVPIMLTADVGGAGAAARQARPAPWRRQRRSACRNSPIRRPLAETLPGFAFSAWCAFLLPAKRRRRSSEAQRGNPRRAERSGGEQAPHSSLASSSRRPRPSNSGLHERGSTRAPAT